MKTVTILTIARSGSSLLAGILHRLGVDMGSQEELLIGEHLNRYGSHENQDFIAFSVNILLDVGILLDFRKRLTDYEEDMKETAEKYRGQFRQLLQKHAKALWGFKETSSIYYLPYLEDELENPYYIHLIRNSDSTARSLLAMISSKNWKHEYRDKMPFLTRRRRWKLYLRILRLLITERKHRNVEMFKKVVANAHSRIKTFLEGKRHLKIHTERIVEKPEETIQNIVDFLQINPTKEQIQAAKEFIHPELFTK